MPEYIAYKLSPIAQALRTQPLSIVSAAIPGTLPTTTPYTVYPNGNGAGSNLLLYGGIAVLLALVAGGGYYYWFHVREAKEEK